MSRQLGKRTQITPELITNILKDRHHKHFTMVQLKEKYKIGNKNIKQTIDTYSEKYLEKFPVKAGANISVDTLQEFWENSTQSELISS